MKSILFVDDEPRLLEGLQRMLRPQRKLWDMSFAGGGAEALAILATKPFDVVVTDMRMPEMDGARLLELVRERHPSVVRIVLSGYFETETALRAVPVAHQFLVKPCDPQKLREAIERSCFFAGLLPDEAIRRVVGAIGNLPSLPRTSALLMEAMQQPDIGLEAISRIVEQDVAITAKVLQLVNSAFFCLSREITSVSMAVSYLGLDTIRQLVVSVEIFRTLQPGRAIAGFSLADLQKHSRLAAGIVARLPVSKPIASVAVVAAMLHDSGKLVLASRLPEQFETALRLSTQRGVPLHTIEDEVLGTSHAAIGAYLLGLWGLPGTVVDAVWRHHNPAAMEGAGEGLTTAGVVHIADALSFELANETEGDAPAGEPGLLNIEYLTQFGLAEKLEGWRAIARQVFQEQQLEV